MKKSLNANALKLIAIAAMTIDHIAWMLFSGYPTDILPVAMHIIGRITCPIMCYFIAEGYHHTRDVRKYTRRLLIFALISHFAYVFSSMDFAGWRSFIPFSGGKILNQTSVMWPLACGLMMLRVVNSTKIRRDIYKTLLVLLLCLLSFPSDWSCVASLCILAFGTNRGKTKTQMLWMVFYVAIYAAVYFFCLDKFYGAMQMAVVLAIPLIMMYNGRKAKNPRANGIMKWLFYIYYPLHLLIIGLIQLLK